MISQEMVAESIFEEQKLDHKLVQSTKMNLKSETPSPSKKVNSKPNVALTNPFDSGSKKQDPKAEYSAGRYSVKTNKTSNDALSNKMPNFIMNYNDLIQMVTKSKNQKTSLNSNNNQPTHTDKCNTPSNSTTSTTKESYRSKISKTIASKAGFKNNSNQSESSYNNKERIIIISQSEATKQHITNFSETLKSAPECCPFSFPPEWKNSDLCKMGTLTHVSKFSHESERIDDLVTTVKQKKNSPSIISAISLNPIQSEEERCKEVKSLTNTEEIRDFYENTEECLKRIAKIQPVNIKEIDHLLFDLPFEEELKTKKLAVFDLDETLVHCEIKKPSRGEVLITVKIPSGATTKVGLNIRPFWRESLQEISKNYVIIVYTASHQSYADSVLDFLDPERKLIRFRLYRQHCVKVKVESDYIYVKDMRIFRNVPLSRSIIIDNSALSFAFQLMNGVPILPFYNNKEDNELQFLTHYLNHICKGEDLREENRRNLKMDYFLHTVEDSLIHSEDEEPTGVKYTSNGLISLNACDETQSEDASIDLSMDLSFERSKLKCPNKKTSCMREELILTLYDLKKTLELNLTKKKK